MDDNDRKKKRPGILDNPSQKMGADTDQSSYEGGRLGALAQGQPLGMIQQAMPNMAEIALNQKTNSENMQLGNNSPMMDRIQNGVARKVGQPKAKLFS